MNHDADPKKTLELLRALVELGFTDVAFAQLHHFRLKKAIALMSAHRRYCEKIESFQGDNENERVHHRLQLVLDAYLAGGFRSDDVRVFPALANAAFREIPPLPGNQPPAPAGAASAFAATR